VRHYNISATPEFPDWSVAVIVIVYCLPSISLPALADYRLRDMIPVAWSITGVVQKPGPDWLQAIVTPRVTGRPLSSSALAWMVIGTIFPFGGQRIVWLGMGEMVGAMVSITVTVKVLTTGPLTPSLACSEIRCSPRSKSVVVKGGMLTGLPPCYGWRGVFNSEKHIVTHRHESVIHRIIIFFSLT
jgi:hypothetical protein